MTKIVTFYIVSFCFTLNLKSNKMTLVYITLLKKQLVGLNTPYIGWLLVGWLAKS